MDGYDSARSGGSDYDTIKESIFVPRPCMQAAQLFRSGDKVDKRVVKLFQTAQNKNKPK